MPSGLQEQLRERTSWLVQHTGCDAKELGRTRGYRAAKCYACSSTWCLTLLDTHAFFPKQMHVKQALHPDLRSSSGTNFGILTHETVSYTAKADLFCFTAIVQVLW